MFSELLPLHITVLSTPVTVLTVFVATFYLQMSCYLFSSWGTWDFYTVKIFFGEKKPAQNSLAVATQLGQLCRPPQFHLRHA